MNEYKLFSFNINLFNILLPSVDMMANKRKTVIDAVILFMMILFISLSEINGKD